MTAAMLTPFLEDEASRVELANRVWRKRLLPIGDIDYKGRTLKFTRDYLGRIVTAFNDRAYDQVPFQLADHANTHTNDPERTRGEITGMELGEDGLYVTARLTPDGEKVLEANPKLGVSARIVEGYARSDGKHFSAAVQHVLGTLDPRIPGLGAWEAIEAASPEPESVLDLSAESFVNLVGPEGYVHGWKHVGVGTTVVPDKVMNAPAGWLGKGTKNLNQGEAADKMSTNIAKHSFNGGAGGREAQQAHRTAAKAHRAAAKNADSQSSISHHTRMAKVHTAVAAGRMSYNTDLAGDGTDPEGGAVMAGLKSLSDDQKARLEKLLALSDETLDALAAGGTVVTPQELQALTSPGDDDGEDDDEASDLADEIASMTDEELAALKAEFKAEGTEAGPPAFTPNYMPEGEPVAAGLTAEAQFEINLARAQGEETKRELAVVTARLREQDFLAERDRLFHNFGVPPYITDLARPALEGNGHVIEMSNGKTADIGQIVRQVMTEMARLGGLRDLGGAELGSPMDEPDGVRQEEVAESRAALVSDFKSMTGLK